MYPSKALLFNPDMSKWASEIKEYQAKTYKACSVLLNPLETEIASSPHQIVYEEDRVKLKHYPAQPGPSLKPPLLVVYAHINRETMLDLQPDRSVVRLLTQRGIDVYMIDWGYPTRKDRYLTIGDHVNGYLNNIVDHIMETSQCDQVNLMGICMGGTLSVIYAALYPEKVRNLITTVTPTNFDTDEGLLHVWMKQIDVDRMVDTYGNIPGDLMNLGFLLLNPARLMIDKYVGFLKHMDDKAFVENFIRMEKWIFDSPDVPGETFRQFVKDCYQKNLLIKSEMVIDGRRIDLQKISMPVLNFYAKYDHLVPPGACNQFTSKVASNDKSDICLDTGHIGIYVSSKTQDAFAPKIADWLWERAPAIREAAERRIPTPAKIAKAG